jgi:hypothetical protein
MDSKCQMEDKAGGSGRAEGDGLMDWWIDGARNENEPSVTFYNLP